MSIFNKGRTFCFVARDNHESDEQHYDRGHFVASQRPHNDNEYADAVRYSRVFVNSTYLGCQYGDNVMAKLENMTKKM